MSRTFEMMLAVRNGGLGRCEEVERWTAHDNVSDL